MSKNPYKGLHIDKALIPVWVEQFCIDSFEEFTFSEIRHVSSNQYRCELSGNKKVFLVDFYYNVDGTTSLNPKVGQNIDLSIRLASYIASKLEYKETDVRGSSYSVTQIKPDEVEFIIEYLESLDGIKLLEKVRNDSNKYFLYKYQGKTGDRITLKHFDNTRFQVQGKPYQLYQEVTCLLSAYFPFDEIVKKQAEYFSVDINPAEIRNEMQQLMPTAYDVLDEQLRKVLSPSLALRKIDIPLEDYSCFVFPALKTLEGYLKSLFGKHNIIIKKDGFGDYLTYWGKSAVLRPDARNKIGNEKAVAGIEKCYTYYYQHRHRLFHADAVASATRIIETKESACSIINHVLDLIESSHIELSH